MSASDQQPGSGKQWQRLAGLGFEFAATMIGFVLIGLWVDYHWEIERHWGVIIATIIGVVGGLYNFLRQAVRALQLADKRDNRPDGSKPPGEG